MKSTATRPVGTTSFVSGHLVRSVVSSDEPERQRLRALSDLASALPSPVDIEASGTCVSAVATTPDFHPGKPVPVGVVVDMQGGFMPHLIGNDIGCGMRMIALEGISPEELAPALEANLRHVFFQGGRDIALTGHDRHAILREGIPGLLESLATGRKGLLEKLDLDAAWQETDRTCDDGFFSTDRIDPGFEDYADMDAGFRHDAILGTIGGGNHFVEFGVVQRMEDGAFAAAAGLKTGTVVLVVHSGSLDFGQRVGSTARERLGSRKGIAYDPRILSATADPELFARYRNGQANAVNAAFVNRFLIGLAAIEAVRRTIGREVGHRLVYDAPHNAVWQDGETFRHRKGACAARGTGALRGSPYEWLGEPVILPGSMGDGTWLLKGNGSANGLESSAHGAGRRLSRQEARRSAAVPSRLCVVGPVDPKSPSLRGRPDILKEIEGRLNEEAPGAYRPIEDVVSPMVEAGLVDRVAQIQPLVTVKG